MKKKKFIACLCSILAFCFCFSASVYAVEPAEILISQSTEFYEDGTSCVISVYQDVPLTRASGTTTGHKDYQYSDGTGVVFWTLTVRGAYSYTGFSATCTDVSCTYSIADSAWSRVSTSKSRSGNTATAYGTFARDGQNKSASVSLSCDANGNLS